MVRTRSSNRLLVPGSAAVLQQYKEEIASEFGVKLGESTTARLRFCRRGDYQTVGTSGPTAADRRATEIGQSLGINRCGHGPHRFYCGRTQTSAVRS